MNKKTDEPKQPIEPRRAWTKPTLTRLGHLKDFVQGFRKRGSRTDGDPFTHRKV